MARLFVISGPSGVGKGTIVRRLLALRPHLAYSVSCTTRAPRRDEVDGRDYRFVSPRTFDELVEEGAFLEWAEVFGNRYGTLRGPINEALAAGRDVVLEIDMQGARSVRDRIPDAVLIFLDPPSLEELQRRLRTRRTETEEQAAKRLARAREETKERSRFDFVVTNDEVDRAAGELVAIIDRVSAGGAATP